MARNLRTAKVSWIVGLTIVGAGWAISGEPVPPPAARPSALPTLPGARAEEKQDAEGAVVPGSRVAVSTEGPHASGATFRWTQLEGPPVKIDDPEAEKIRFTVPTGADRVVFLVTVNDRSGAKTVKVAVPIASPPEPRKLPATLAESTPTADAGEDRVGEVGRATTLDGSRSRAQGVAAYRWIAASGPPSEQWKSDGSKASFVPSSPGSYRFALVVASGGKISEPSFVVVEVPPPAPTEAPETPLSRSVAATIATIPGGRDTASQVADVFEAIAGKAPLYSSFAQLQGELTRRLDVVVPTEPAARAAWTGSIFLPLSRITAAELAKAGIDARSPAADGPLTDAQKDQLQDLYQGLADAFRPRQAKP